jgi:hypothetical protein
MPACDISRGSLAPHVRVDGRVKPGHDVMMRAARYFTPPSVSRYQAMIAET